MPTAGHDQKEPRGPALELHSPLLGGRIRVRSPDPQEPFWHGEDGERHSYGSLRCGLHHEGVGELGEAHLAAIGLIAAAALEASRDGDQRETARLAMAAGRLCEEIAGRWTPAAVEVPER